MPRGDLICDIRLALRQLRRQPAFASIAIVSLALATEDIGVLTVRLTADTVGRENTGVFYGWIVARHQLDASFGAGVVRAA